MPIGAACCNDCAQAIEGLLQRLGFQRTAAMHAVFFSGIAALVSAMGIHSVCV